MSWVRPVRLARAAVCAAAFVALLAACGSKITIDSGAGTGGSSTTTTTTSTSNSSASTGSAGAGAGCEVPTSEISSVEAVELARCVVPDGEQARLLGYATSGHSTAPGKYDRWELVFQDDDVTYRATAGADVLFSDVWHENGGGDEPFPTECMPSTLPVLDTTQLLPVALQALQAGDAPLDWFAFVFSLSCLDWGSDGYAIVGTSWGWEGGSDYAVFSPSGELLLVCGPCDFGWVECCGLP